MFLVADCKNYPVVQKRGAVFSPYPQTDDVTELNVGMAGDGVGFMSESIAV